MNRDGQSGVAIVMAVFVLALLTGMGVALLFLSQHELRMSHRGLQAKRAFYLAESGVEDGRVTLFLANGGDDFDTDLLAAAGGDGVIDFDPDSLTVSYDSDGNVITVAGFDDDVPLRTLTAFDSDGQRGWYLAFLTNDQLEFGGTTTLSDTNARVLITGVGAGPRGVMEVAQAIVEPHQYLPVPPPAAVTMLGPNPLFDDDEGDDVVHDGNDCGSVGGAHAPIIGAIGATARDTVRTAMDHPEDFNSGTYGGTATVSDLTDSGDPLVTAAGQGVIDPFWQDCASVKQMVEALANSADYYCDTDLGSCAMPSTSGPDDIVFVDGDLTGTPAGSRSGILVVTGRLDLDEATDWDGVILVVGAGEMVREVVGGATASGTVVIANIDPSPAGTRADKSDWCSSGFEQSIYRIEDDGVGTVQWCTSDADAANSIRSYKVVQFLQR